MASATETTQSVQPERPGMIDGVSAEFTIFCKIKPGKAEALRALLNSIRSTDMATVRASLEEIGTLHDARHVIFDNDTRFLFASVFDGSWDTYIDDFSATSIGDNFEKVFQHMEGFPGMKSPTIKEWFVSQQAGALVFGTSYPDLTVQQIWKDQRVNEAFQAVLDSPEFRAALDNPANAELVATPAFQKLLTESEG
jgi:hypothetical protein